MNPTTYWLRIALCAIMAIGGYRGLVALNRGDTLRAIYWQLNVVALCVVLGSELVE